MPTNLFQVNEQEVIGTVFKVDSYSVSVHVPDENVLRRVSVNGFAMLHTSNPNIRLVGRISRVVRLEMEQEVREDEEEVEELESVQSVVHVIALGTLRGPGGGRIRPTFTRTVETLPEIGASCVLLTGDKLSSFARLVADETASGENPLIIGDYTMAPDAPAILDGNAFFQRHAMVVGSTGSGKSWTVATIVEQVAELRRANMVVFDLHGEYQPLEEHPNVTRYRIAGPGDLNQPGDDIIFLPYWLLGYEDMLALVLDRSDENAPNQAMAFSNAVKEAKYQALIAADMGDISETFTIDSPIPYSMDAVVERLEHLNTERVEGARGLVNGPFNGRFSRFLPRLAAKRNDRRHGFLFHLGEEQLQPRYLNHIINRLMKVSDQGSPGVKIIDFSEVPSDILPIVISLVARIIFQVQQWSDANNRHPIALVCDEAHLYLPARQAADAAELRALAHFERIAKEGRKYGLGLLIISQRPSELNTTVMSQCNNVVALRLANQSDKTAVANLLPENLGSIQEILPTLGVGEAIVVGDACLLPSRIKISEPTYKPNSASIAFWKIWGDETYTQDLDGAVRNMIRQTTGRVTNVEVHQG